MIQIKLMRLVTKELAQQYLINKSTLVYEVSINY